MEADFGIATGAYEDVREDWFAAVARATREGWRFVELTALGDSRLAQLRSLDPSSLAPFERVSLHAPTTGHTADELVAHVDALPFRCDVVLHPDAWRDPVLGSLGARAVFENMDVNKTYGRSVADLAEVFERFPDAGFCLDVAHVWTNDPSLSLGHALLDAFGERLRQVHVSGIEADGTHRDTTEADLDLYLPLLARCRSVPWLLEAVRAAP